MDERERCQSTSNRQWPEGLDMQEAMADAASPSPQNWKRSDSLKIFSRAMMRDWRKRGEEMHHLQKETEYLRGEYKQTNNTVHMCKALKQVELERNSDLQLELMKSNLNFEEFHSSISSLTEVKEKLLNEVEMRKREHDELQAVADQRKTELNAALGELRNDENRLLDEEDVMNHLRTNNANLVNEIALLRWLQMKYKMSEKCLTKKLEEANERMTIMQDELNFLHDRVRAWNT
ncbi:GL19366 [Drosophila persimilis]|nr:GL19366 [Drosophila persimilis]